MPARIKNCKSPEQLEEWLDDYSLQGYRITQQTQSMTKLKKDTWGTMAGHLIWFLLTFWFTLGIGNLIYAMIAHSTAEEIVIKCKSC